MDISHQLNMSWSGGIIEKRLNRDSTFMWQDHYAYAINKGDPEWLAYINAFVSRIKKDGRLKKYAEANGLLPIAYLD